MPELPPWTRKVSPPFSPTRRKALIQTVNTVSGRQAAASIDIPSGTGRAWSAGVTAYSA